MGGTSEMIGIGRDYLRSTMESGWTWRFFGPGSHLPPDWDDTACALVGLADPGANNRALSNHLNYRRSDGWYWTWMLDIGPHDHTIKANNIDAVVNANVLFWLTKAGIKDMQLIENLQQFVAEGKFLKRTVYYHTQFPFAYCFSRAVNEGPIPELANAARHVADALITLEIKHSGWGNTLWDGLALMTLLNAGYASRHIVRRTVERMLHTQQADGGWQNAPFFMEYPGLFYGSRDLTSAIVLEGLVAYDQLSNFLNAQSRT